MADGERIPIIIDEPAMEVGAPVADERGIVTTLEEDGTLRIVLPIREPCEPAGPDEIAVCTTAENASPPALPVETEDKTDPLAVRLGENATIGPTASAGSGPMGGTDIRASITLNVKF